MMSLLTYPYIFLCLIKSYSLLDFNLQTGHHVNNFLIGYDSLDMINWHHLIGHSISY